jgi:hypothetical protein
MMMSPGTKSTTRSGPASKGARDRNRNHRQAHQPGDDDVRRRAYELYEARGRAEGHELDDWCKAEAELKQSPNVLPPGETPTD